MLPSLMLFIEVENYIKILGLLFKKQGKKRFVFEFITQNNRFNSNDIYGSGAKTLTS